MVVSASDGPQAQTKEHIFLARTLGVKQIIVGLNKMDATKPAWSEKTFNTVKEDVSALLKSIGYKLEEVPFIPISAYKGDNIRRRPPQHAVVQGRHPDRGPEQAEGAGHPGEPALRLPIQDVYTITGIGTVPVGRVESGTLKPDMKIMFEPAHMVGEVKSVEMHHEQLTQPLPGDNVGFNVRGIAKNDVKRGDVAGPVDNPPTVAKTFIAQIMVLNHPSVITVGYTPVFHIHTAQVACTFLELQKKLDPETGAIKEENPTFLKTGDAAIVKIAALQAHGHREGQGVPPARQVRHP